MSLLAWYLLLFVPQLAMGALVGWCAAHWHGGAQSGDRSSDEATRRRERELRSALSMLKQLTTSVKDDVREHASKVDSSSKELADISENGEDPMAALAALAPIIEANENLEERLAKTEQKLAQQTEQLDQQMIEARTDPLTGLLNRRGLDEELGRRVKECRKAKEPFCLMLLDVDRFKLFNDRYGHDVGDRVLREVARVAAATVRAGDTVARFGGEELVALLPAADLQQAKKVAEDVRQAIEAHTVATEEGRLSVTVSVGVAEAASESNEALMKRADQALYTAKDGGRNCTYYHDGKKCHPVEGRSPAGETLRSDELTQLPNRRAFLEEASRRLAESFRYGDELAVVVLQVDQLEEFTAKGDEMTADLVRRGMARFLGGIMREMDLVAREAENSFAILLPGCTQNDATGVAERVRRAAAKTPLRTEPSELTLTVSVGVASAMPGEDAEALLARAEQALQKARGSEGDCVFTDAAEEADGTVATAAEGVAAGS